MSAPSLLFVNPWIYDFAAFDLWSKPFGLLSLAALARKCGARVRLWDGMTYAHPDLSGVSPKRRSFGTGKFLRQEVEKPSQLKDVHRRYFRYGLPPDLFDRYLASISGEPPDVVFVTSLMTYWHLGVSETISAVRRFFPKARIVLGGIYATLCPEHAREHAGADIVVTGPGETFLLDMLQDFGSTPPIDPFGAKERIFDIPPAFDLLDHVDYLCVLTSRGCPFRCHYCASKLLYPGFVERLPDAVFEEIREGVVMFGVRDIAFYDDALLIHRGTRIRPLLERIVASGMNVRLHAPNGLHVRAVTPELALLMKAAGFVTLRMGYESADMDWHSQTGGKIGKGDMALAVEALRRAGFHEHDVGVYILIGVPGQKPEQIEQSILEVRALNARPYLAEYSPIPGTDMWREAVSHARYDIEREPLYHNNSLIPCASQELTAERLRTLKHLCVV